MSGIGLHGQLFIEGNDSSDGALVVTQNRVIDLSEAVTGVWSANNSANSGKGVYDPEKWAVVFKFESITINAGAAVTFINHPSRAPVVWLVKGNVTINGVVNLRGAPGPGAPSQFGTEPGPGGFRGVAAGPAGVGHGFGPYFGPQGLHASVYGNPQIIPLMGGSGGTGASGYYGGGGGGAILIASEGRITLAQSGSILTEGGLSNGSLSASGGAIRLVANELVGTGILSASNEGRIRLEANNSREQRFVKSADTQAFLPGNIARLWPQADAAKVRIVSVNGLSTPADPRSRIDDGADVQIETGANVDVEIETEDFPTSGTVMLRVGPKFGPATQTQAELVSGDRNLARWRVSRVFANGFSVMQVRAFVARQ
jgi:hypothetical protein